jgi:hypothetical protein
MWYVSRAKSNSVNQIVKFLEANPGKSEAEIHLLVFGTYAAEKKHKEMLRRGLDKGIIGRVKCLNPKSKTKYFYFVPQK